MRQRLISRIAVGLLAAGVLLGAPAGAEADPSARKWLDKMTALYERGPFTVDYSATINLGQGGQAIQGTLEGRIIYGDRQNSRFEMSMALSGLPGAGGESGAPTAMELLSVKDGTVNWTEFEMAGTRQVTKVSEEDAAKLAESAMGGAFAGNPSSLDPVAQLEVMTWTMDFEVVGVAEGRVTLRGKLNEESRAQLGQMPPSGSIRSC